MKWILLTSLAMAAPAFAQTKTLDCVSAAGATHPTRLAVRGDSDLFGRVGKGVVHGAIRIQGHIRRFRMNVESYYLKGASINIFSEPRPGEASRFLLNDRFQEADQFQMTLFGKLRVPLTCKFR